MASVLNVALLFDIADRERVSAVHSIGSQRSPAVCRARMRCTHTQSEPPVKLVSHLSFFHHDFSGIVPK